MFRLTTGRDFTKKLPKNSPLELLLDHEATP